MPRWLNWKWLGVVALALAAVLAFSACGDDDDDEDVPTDTPAGSATDAPDGDGENVVTIAPGDKIVVGVTAVLSGDLQALGTTVLKAAELAAQQLGDVEGFEVEVVGADDLCDASGAEPAAQQLLAEENLVAVIGSICSGVNVTVQPTYEQKHITQVSSGSTAVVVTYPEGGEPFDTFLRTVVHDGVQGVKQAEYADSVLGATSVFIAHDTDAYGAGLADVFEENFTGEVVGRQGWEKGQTDFASLVTSVTTDNPDLVYVASFDPEAAAFLTQLRTAGYEGDFLAGDGVITEQFLTLAGDDAEGGHLSKPAPIEETDALLQFQADYLEYAGFPWDDQPYAAQTYDAYTAIFNALTEVAELDGDNLVIDLDALNDAIHAADFDGITGHVSFDDHGDIEAAPGKPQIIFFKVEGGEYVQQDFE
jgi:branched-chain amino acid transport system substrate-binding protein